MWPQKQAHTDLQINWKPHAPFQWKIETITKLVKRAETVDSTTILQHEKIEHRKALFTEADIFIEIPYQDQKQNSFSKFISREKF